MCLQLAHSDPTPQSLEQISAEMSILYNRSIVREVNQEMIRTARFEFCVLAAEMTDETDGTHACV